MDIKFEIENIPRYDWTYSDGMNFNRGAGRYVTWSDAKEIWDALLNKVRMLENENESLCEQLAEAHAQINSMWKTIAP